MSLLLLGGRQSRQQLAHITNVFRGGL